MHALHLPTDNSIQKCVRSVAKIKKFIFSFAIFGIICLYLWGFTPFLLNPSEFIAMRSVLIKPIHPDSKGRCRQYDNTRFICLPNVFLLGASKSGTSSWFSYLVQHPRVASVMRRMNGVHDVSNEVHRFDNPWFHFYPMKINRAMEWAASPVVANMSMSILHYTPQYIYAPSVPYDMNKFYPHPSDMKFIVILRNPVDRAVSSYWFKNSKKFTKDKKDRGSLKEFMKNFYIEKAKRQKFEKCLEDNDLYTPYRKASLLTKKELSSNFDNLQKCFGPDFRNPKIGLRHIDKGIYFDQLDRWLQNFHRKQFLIILYDEWISSPLQTYKDVMQFIGQELTGPYGFNSIEDVKNIIKKKHGVVHNTRRQDLLPSMRQEVECFYKPYNTQLALLLNRNSIFNSSSIVCS